MCNLGKKKLRGQLLFNFKSLAQISDADEDWNVEEDEEFLNRINVISVRPS
jgi:hypothetical protein